jgi:hypothetical protein
MLLKSDGRFPSYRHLLNVPFLKKVLFFLLLSILNVFGTAHQFLGWNWIEVVFKKYDIIYERIITNRNSIRINPVFGGIYNNDEWQLRFNLAYNHFFKENYKGWCLSPFVSFYYAQAEYSNALPHKQTLKTISPGLSISYHWLFNDKFNIGAGIGAGPVIELQRNNLMRKDKVFFLDIAQIGIIL